MADYGKDNAPSDELEGKEINDNGNRREKSALDDGQDKNAGDDGKHVTAEEMTAKIANAINAFPHGGARRTRQALFLLKRINGNDSTGKHIKLHSQQRMLQDLVNDKVPGREEMMKGCDRRKNHLWFAATLLHVEDIDKPNPRIPPQWENNQHVWPRVFRVRDILGGIEKPHPVRVPKDENPDHKADGTEMAKAKRGREEDGETKPPAKKARRSKAPVKDMSAKDAEEDERLELEAARRSSRIGVIARSPLPLPYAGHRSSVDNDVQPETAGIIQPPRYLNPQVLQLNGVPPTNILHLANNGPQTMQHDLGIYDNAQALSAHDPFFGFEPASSNQASAIHEFDGSLQGFYQQPHAQHNNIAAASDAARLIGSGALYYGPEIVPSSQLGSAPVRYVGDLRPGHAGDSASNPFHDHDQGTLNFTDGSPQQTDGETPSILNASNGEDPTANFSYLSDFDEFFDYEKYSNDHAGH
ncbi:hypothetical protein CcaCcLH18_06981 [Colletotrichum camelliae]|nr:hypothetical protein CcaCcLH18_06981 [Colletotrichum camelliae]